MAPVPLTRKYISRRCWGLLTSRGLRLTFRSFVMVQIAGASPYLIYRHVYYRYMVFTKKGIGLVALSVTQVRTTTQIHVSGDKSVKGQSSMVNGKIVHDFPPRINQISNHQVFKSQTPVFVSLLTALAI